MRKVLDCRLLSEYAVGFRSTTCRCVSYCLHGYADLLHVDFSGEIESAD